MSHPWADFLEARLKVITWMQIKMGSNDEEIAYHLSMDPTQVYLLRKYIEDRKKADENSH